MDGNGKRRNRKGMKGKMKGEWKVEKEGGMRRNREKEMDKRDWIVKKRGIGEETGG